MTAEACVDPVLKVEDIRVAKFCELTGYTTNAVNLKISRGVWLEGYEYHRSETGEITIHLPGYQRWARGKPRVKDSHGQNSK